MAKTEIFNCDLCGEEAHIVMTFTDKRLPQDQTKNTDLCDKHFSILRSFIRHEMPPFKNITADDGK